MAVTKSKTSAPQKEIDKMDFYLKSLALHTIKNNYLSEADNAMKTNLSYQDYLLRLIEQEVLSKIDRSINRKIQIAGFPQIKRLEEFDFSYQPQLDEKLILELAALKFLNERKNVLFLGPPGVGKTHLAIAIGLKAAQQRKRVAFYSAEQLTALLAANEAGGMLNTFIESTSRIDLVIIDELGYLELSKKTAALFFRLIAKCYEKNSVIVTSNKPFEEWGAIFQDDVVAAAILDRLLHHSYPFFIQGKSFRMKNLMQN